MRYIETREIPIAELRRFPGNARLHDKPTLRRSARTLGQYRSVLGRLHEDGMITILAGNGTTDAFESNGVETMRVELIECTDNEARQFNAVDNQASDRATNDSEALLALLEQIDGYDPAVGFPELGFPVEAIAALSATDTMPAPGDADVDDLDHTRWGVIIECGDEDQQAGLLEEFTKRGLNVRAIM